MAIRSFNGIQPTLGQNVFIDETAVVTGRVLLGDDASVWPQVSIRGDLMPIEIGARSNIQDNSVLHTSHDSQFSPGGHALKIGEDVTVGHGVILHGCTIGDRVLIGMGSIVLDGVTLEDEVFLAAGSMVPPGKILEGGFLWLGRPAKKIRPLTEEERDFFRYSASHYVSLQKQHQKNLKKLLTE